MSTQEQVHFSLVGLYFGANGGRLVAEIEVKDGSLQAILYVDMQPKKSQDRRLVPLNHTCNL